MTAPLVDTEVINAVTAWRRDIHAHPEMAFCENRTAALVAEQLASFGMTVSTGIATTGVVGELHFGEGPTIALRADMDALPINEANSVDYKSTHDDCMHACGHDGHTAMLLGAAKLLSKRTDLVGKLLFIFQPAEENEGGAREMIAQGALDRFPFDSIYALHNMPGLPVGEFRVRAGPLLASFDKFDINITGKGGHGAMPDQCKDPILAASGLATELNTIVSRDVDPGSAAVVTVGQFLAEGTYNVIPDVATLKGSCRAIEPEARANIEQRIKRICEGVATSFDVAVECNFQRGYPALKNSLVESDRVGNALDRVVGAENVGRTFDPLMGSEDFAFFLQKKPGCYFLIGNGDHGGPLHSSTYDFCDAATPYGIAAWVSIAEEFLGKGAE